MEKCPKCKSTEVSGRVDPFWTALNEDGTPATRLGDSVEGDTEVGSARLCRACGHEYEEGDEVAEPSPLPQLKKLASQTALISTEFSRLGLRFLEIGALYLERIVELEIENQSKKHKKHDK